MHQENLIAMNSNFETLPIKFQSLLCRSTVVNWDFTTRQQAYLHSLRTDAKLKIHQVYKHKSSSSMRNRSSAKSFRLRCQTRPGCSKRGTTERQIWNTFSIAKTYCDFSHASRRVSNPSRRVDTTPLIFFTISFFKKKVIKNT